MVSGGERVIGTVEVRLELRQLPLVAGIRCARGFEEGGFGDDDSNPLREHGVPHHRVCFVGAHLQGVRKVIGLKADGEGALARDSLR